MSSKRKSYLIRAALLVVAAALFAEPVRVTAMLFCRTLYYDLNVSWVLYPGAAAAGALLGFLIGWLIERRAEHFHWPVVPGTRFYGMRSGLWLVPAGFFVWEVLYVLTRVLTYHG